MLRWRIHLKNKRFLCFFNILLRIIVKVRAAQLKSQAGQKSLGILKVQNRFVLTNIQVFFQAKKAEWMILWALRAKFKTSTGHILT